MLAGMVLGIVYHRLPVCVCLPIENRESPLGDHHGRPWRSPAGETPARQTPARRSSRAQPPGLVEGTHGEAKSRRGLRRTMRRRLWKTRIHAWLTAAAINLKGLAKASLRRIFRLKPPNRLSCRVLYPLHDTLSRRSKLTPNSA